MEGSFDYIVVGAGSSGAIVATRLAERTSGNVLLLEAGESRERDFWVRIPLGCAKVIGNPRYAWHFFTEEQKSLVGQSICWPRGRMLGGSSGINGTIFVRGDPAEFDHWRQLGNTGWSYDNVLPYFQRFENVAFGSDRVRGRQGPVGIASLADMPDPLSNAFLDACVSAGIPVNPDYNGEDYEGVGYLQLNTSSGRRVDTATAFLRGLPQKNLRIVTGAVARRILLADRQAQGVEYEIDGDVRYAMANREVILSAGPVKSPQLLELSGIGHADLLDDLGIETTHHLPGVGENLVDHLQTRITYRASKPVGLNRVIGHPIRQTLLGAQYLLTRKGPLATPAFTVHALARTPRDDALSRPRPSCKLQISCLSSATRMEMAPDGGKVTLDDYDGFSIGCFQLKPSSRGAVHCKTANPLDAPMIEPNYLVEEDDQQDMIASVRLAREVAKQPRLAAYVAEETRPSTAVESDEDLLGYIKKSGATSYHPVGTCKMGIDSMAVVDPTLAVQGISRLRVVDSSIMPTMPSSNTNAASMMIGEKGADLILADAGC